jgi:glycerol-3-phosphate acyltransferase PlsY
MSDLSFWQKARIEWAVQRIDLVLDGRVPRARRKQIRDELRSNLTEAVRQVGAEQAVRQLGDLRTLARSYLELYRGRWDFRAGSWAVIFTYAAIEVVSLAIWLAFSTGVLAGGGHAASYSLWDGFGPFGGSVVATHSFVWLFFSPAHLGLMALAFLIGSSYRQILHLDRAAS